MAPIGSAVIYLLTAFMLVTLGLSIAGRLPARRLGAIWGGIALPVLAVGLVLGLTWAPPDRDMGEVQRIMYVLFPAWVAVAAAFTTTLVCSVLYLV